MVQWSSCTPPMVLQIVHSPYSVHSTSTSVCGGPGVVRPKFGFGFGYAVETDLTCGFGLVSATAVTEYSVSAHFRLRPKPEKVVSVGL